MENCCNKLLTAVKGTASKFTSKKIVSWLRSAGEAFIELLTANKDQPCSLEESDIQCVLRTGVVGQLE